MTKPFRTALTIASVAMVGAVGIGVGVANATSSTPTPNQQAISEMEIAKSHIDKAESILNAQSSAVPTATALPTTTVPVPNPSTTNNGTTGTATVPSPAPVATPTTSTDTSAGTTLNWGAPNAQYSDEFNTVGAPDPNKWNNAPSSCFAGNGGNGKRCGINASIKSINGETFLRETGQSNGNTGWLSSKLDKKYGMWEDRMRLSPSTGSGNKYHPVLLLWTDAVPWPQGGEVDYTEVNIGDANDYAFIHKPAPSGNAQDSYKSSTLDLTQWHDYAVQWTSQGITGYIDGKQWFQDNNSGSLPTGAMHATIQLDNNNGTSEQPATLDVDYFHVW